MNTLPLLVKREYWEHRGGFLWTPVWICAAILIITVLGIISAEVFRTHAHVSLGFSLDALRGEITDDKMAEAGNGLDVAQLMFGGLVSVGLFFVTFFYLLGALYDDRRDRSVLFWKSLPVSDTATVASKALTAMLLVPAIALVVATLAYLAFLVLVCVWTGVHGLNPLPALLGAHPIGMFMRLVATLPISALWALPTIGWLLLWSAFARSKPFLWAVVVPILVVVFNGWFGLIGLPSFVGSDVLRNVLGRLLFSIVPGSWVFAEGANVLGTHVSFSANDDHIVRSLDLGYVYGVLGSTNLWLGALAGAAMIAMAVRLRGRRIDTST